MGVIVYNGKSSDEYKIKVATHPAHEFPERECVVQHVPGRSGDIVVDLGTYKNVTRTYSISKGSCDGDFEKIAHDIVSWLQSGKGYARLEDDYEPDCFRLGIFQSAGSVSNVLNRAGALNLQFNCKPQRYLKIGEKPIRLPANAGGLQSIVIHNPTQYESKPLIHFRARYNTEMRINGYPINIVDAAPGYTINYSLSSKVGNPNNAMAYPVVYKDDVRYDPSKTYVKDEFVSYVDPEDVDPDDPDKDYSAGMYYKAIASTVTGPWDRSKWEHITSDDFVWLEEAIGGGVTLFSKPFTVRLQIKSDVNVGVQEKQTFVVTYKIHGFDDGTWRPGISPPRPPKKPHRTVNVFVRIDVLPGETQSNEIVKSYSPLNHLPDFYSIERVIELFGWWPWVVSDVKIFRGEETVHVPGFDECDVYIDCESGEIYGISTVDGSFVLLGSNIELSNGFPVLSPGENKIEVELNRSEGVDPSLTFMEVIPRWWTL